jgi:hypothetical protein
MYFIQHCFICSPSDITVPEDDATESRTVATLALEVKRSNRLVMSHPLTRLVLIQGMQKFTNKLCFSVMFFSTLVFACGTSYGVLFFARSLQVNINNIVFLF